MMFGSVGKQSGGIGGVKVIRQVTATIWRRGVYSNWHTRGQQRTGGGVWRKKLMTDLLFLYPRDAMLARVIAMALSPCLSVCVCVCL